MSLRGSLSTGQKLLFPSLPSSAPQSCSPTPGTAPQSKHTTEVQEAAHSSQPIHFSSSSDAADSSPAPYKMLRMQPHTLYAGNCQSAFLQKLGLVMSFLTTDPNIYHSSRVKYKSTVYTVSSSVSETLDVAGLNNGTFGY